MKKYALLFFLICLLIGDIFGQTSGQSVMKIDFHYERGLDADKSTDTLLLGLVEEIPSPTATIYRIMAVCKNGDVRKRRYIKN